jgi:hypothetical protein
MVVLPLVYHKAKRCRPRNCNDRYVFCPIKLLYSLLKFYAVVLSYSVHCVSIYFCKRTFIWTKLMFLFIERR